MKKLEAVGELMKIKDDRLGMKFHRVVFGRLGDQGNAEFFHWYPELVNEFWNYHPAKSKACPLCRRHFGPHDLFFGRLDEITFKMGEIVANELLMAHANFFRDLTTLVETFPAPQEKPHTPFSIPPASPAYLAAYAILSKKPRQAKYARDELRRWIKKYLRQQAYPTQLSHSTLTRIIDAFRLEVLKKRPGRKTTKAGRSQKARRERP